MWAVPTTRSRQVHQVKSGGQETNDRDLIESYLSDGRRRRLISSSSTGERGHGDQGQYHCRDPYKRHFICVQSPVVESFKIVLNLKINRLIDQQPRLFLEWTLRSPWVWGRSYKPYPVNCVSNSGNIAISPSVEPNRRELGTPDLVISRRGV